MIKQEFKTIHFLESNKVFKEGRVGVGKREEGGGGGGRVDIYCYDVH